MAQWRSRIVGNGEVEPASLQGHPENWRLHPEAQKSALSGALRELGWIQQVVVNERTGRLIDGHLRVALALQAEETTIPVLYVDLSEDEECLALVTLDPIAMLAEANKEALAGLLHQVQSGEAGLQAMLSQLGQDEGITPPDFAPVGIDEQGRLDEKAPVECPSCGHLFTP